MRLFKSLPAQMSSGEVKLCPDDADDMWTLYNLISVGDTVASKTTRKVVKQGTGGPQAKSSTERLTISKLPVVVSTVEWDGSTNQIRISGIVPDVVGGYAGDNIKKGQFHTLQLEVNENVYISKDPWDSHDLDQLRAATSVFKDVSAAAVVLHMGLAHVCLITRTMCPTLAKIELSIPKKRAVNNQQTQIDKFFTYVAEAMSQIPSTISCFIIAGPAFVGIDFLTFLQAKYGDKYKWLFPITRTMHASSGHKHALLEALSDGSLGSILVNSGLDTERAAMTEFLTLLNTHPYRAHYGLRDVNTLVREHAGSIKTLMISDGLFKDKDPLKRKSYVQLTESVKHNGGNVLVFSSLNPTAEQLKQLTGIACILSYDIEDLQNDQEYVALEDFINTALDISPLEFPLIDNRYTYSAATHPDQLDDFICQPNGLPQHAVVATPSANSAHISHPVISPSTKSDKDNKHGKDGKDSKHGKDGKSAKDSKDSKDSKDNKDKKSSKKSKKSSNSNSNSNTVKSPEDSDADYDLYGDSTIGGIGDIANGDGGRDNDIGDLF